MCVSQQTQALALKPEQMSLVPRTHDGKGPTSVVFWPPCEHHGMLVPPSLNKKHIKKKAPYIENH